MCKGDQYTQGPVALEYGGVNTNPICHECGAALDCEDPSNPLIEDNYWALLYNVTIPRENLDVDQCSATDVQVTKIGFYRCPPEYCNY